jgi:hypothetical protein
MESDGNVSTASSQQNLSIGALELSTELNRVNLTWRWHKPIQIKLLTKWSASGHFKHKYTQQSHTQCTLLKECVHIV